MTLDGRAILRGIWPPLATWGAAVFTVGVASRQPGVVCVTPLAWLMSLWVGLRCIAVSRSTVKGARLKEAAIAGLIFGVLQGLLFAAVVPLMGPITEAEQQKTVILVVVMILVGSLVSGVLSLAIAASHERRRLR